MKVHRGKIPAGSLCNNHLPVNYADVYVCTVDDLKNITPDDIQVAFWTDHPRWLNNLYKIRNALVKPFGLKGDDNRDSILFEECIRSGKEYKIASIADKSPNETILRLTDKHLIAYFSVYIETENDRKNIYTTTLVHFNNKMGYMYFNAIMPFHHLVVKNILKYTIKKLLKE